MSRITSYSTDYQTFPALFELEPVAGMLLCKVGKRLPEGAAQAARRSVSEMSQTSKQRRRPAEALPEPRHKATAEWLRTMQV